MDFYTKAAMVARVPELAGVLCSCALNLSLWLTHGIFLTLHVCSLTLRARFLTLLVRSLTLAAGRRPRRPCRRLRAAHGTAAQVDPWLTRLDRV